MSQEVRLNTDNINFVSEDPVSLEINPNEPIIFISDDGKEYALIIRKAKEFLNIQKDHLTEKFQAESPPRDFRQEASPKEYSLEIYCITNNSWPAAPPKIIIQRR